MDPAISICPAVAAPGRPRCSNTPFGVMVKSASKLAAAAPAAYIVAAYVAGAARESAPAGSPAWRPGGAGHRPIPEAEADDRGGHEPRPEGERDPPLRTAPRNPGSLS